MTTTTVALILPDQLTQKISALKSCKPEDTLVFMPESKDLFDGINHHKKKLIFLLASMRQFGVELKKSGWTVHSVAIDSPNNSNCLTSEVSKIIKRVNAKRLVITQPNTWKVKKLVESWSKNLHVDTFIPEDNRFLCTHKDFATWASGRKTFRMEYFYREMRKKTNLLMDDGKPVGGKWNYDSENRKTIKQGLSVKPPKNFAPSKITKNVVAVVDKVFDKNFGSSKSFWFATSAKEAERAFNDFLSASLPFFGDYQDAMAKNEYFLFHGVLALYLNVGLLDPLKICTEVEAEFRKGNIPLNAAEGFIRQVIGWREFVRGIYWREMPAYLGENFLNAKKALPEFFWTGDTKMACLKAVIEQTHGEAYAHHIQRLMVTGNFALMAGINPIEVHEWYLAVYADAHEWVELPNTFGMSQFADGGVLASKPYFSSGAYINKMSNYCLDCQYNVKAKIGEKACPFNYLYWNFLDRNSSVLKNNPRLGLSYNSLKKMDMRLRDQYKAEASTFLDSIK